MEREAFIREIEEYCLATSQAPSSFCLNVVRNGALYKRLKSGGDCGIRQLDKIRAYIRENPAPKPDEAA
jgi:hypothetical protein